MKKMKPYQVELDRVSSILVKLPDLDSNQDKQNQNLRYYRYTIGQCEEPCLNCCKVTHFLTYLSSDLVKKFKDVNRKCTVYYLPVLYFAHLF